MEKIENEALAMEQPDMEGAASVAEADAALEMTLPACLNRIMQRVKLGGYTPEAALELSEDLAYVGEMMDVCPEEAVILACVLEKGTGLYLCDDDDISSLIGCTNIEFISYRRYIYSLSKKRIIRISKEGNRGYAYSVLMAACRAIIDNRAFKPTDFSGLDTEGIFSQMRTLFKAFREEEIDQEMLLDDLTSMIDLNPENIFCRKVSEHGIKELCATEQRIFYYLCHRFVSFGDKYMEYRHISDMVSGTFDEQRFARHFQAGKTALQTKGLVCFGGEGEVMDKSKAGLSELVTGEFFTEVELFCETVVEGHRDLRCCADIVQKALFYNASDRAMVERLEQLLQEEHFKGIQSRLESMGMRKGFNIILYGGPGTGKTETVLQLAKKTGRDLLCIDTSKLKSKWVGDSERSVKGLFNVYRCLCKNKERVPILFFNEADAIFGRRMENVDSAASQMLNSLQNIILQEMETLDGIMICTTNLHGNLDPAFERRFIYKVELSKPDESVRTQIWHSMLRGLSDEDYAVLGRRYPFSGGEIENVVRKSTIEYILGGQEASLDAVCRLCDEEAFHSRVKRVGF